ncbi:ankyrin repeat domain-containing protein, partial [Vibrio parahaemolyticus]|uniref:ankyrin repeat domain-containing protein n=1 Tax=Vibrio parahaemolyticus TaxID=670 RepID=UPI001A8F546E|nr:ankyrin repeat domain-containing protein [Vibrio parahaemolyticus]
AEVKCDTKALFRGLSPFLVAILNGHEAVCELLLSNDPKVAHHLSPKGRTALHLAASVGSAKICELLLHYGCQANCVTADAEMKAPMH